MSIFTTHTNRALALALQGLGADMVELPNHDTPPEQVGYVAELLATPPAERMRKFISMFIGHPHFDAIYGDVFSGDAPINDEFKPESLHLSDTGNAEYFAHKFGKVLRFDHIQSRWLHWTGKRWKSDEDGHIIRLAIQSIRDHIEWANKSLDEEKREKTIRWLLGSESRNRLIAMTTISQAIYPLADSGKNWDTNPMLLGVENGVVDLRTGTLRPGHPADRITISTRTFYDASYECPRWLKFLDEVFVDAGTVDFIQRAVGYSLTGDTREQVIFFCHGQGANGKSTFLDTLRAMLGDYAANTPFSTFDQKNPSAIPNDVAALYRARLVTASETNESRRLNEGRVKAMTGDSAMTARFMHKEFFTYKPVYKIWLAMNHKPVIYGTDDGIWRRIRLIPFNQSFKDRPDKTLAETLRNELPGILAWAVAGALKWQESGLGMPKAIKDATNLYRLESDFIAAFIDEALIVHPNARISAKELYQAYRDWCAPRGDDPMNSTNFGKRMAEKGFEKKRLMDGVHYLGIGLPAESSQIFMNSYE